MRQGLEIGRGCNEVFPRLALIEFLKQLTCLVFVAGVAPQREQCIRRKRDETIQRKAPGNVLDMRIEPTILMHHQHSRRLALGICRFDEIALQGAIALRRRDFHEPCLDAGVVARNQLCFCKSGVQGVEQALCRQPRNRILGR
ncbi:hypothetical protein SDC9_186997 [bioreactor metagenome]|uniref:Uncharacterized protein n=1 Tax=bioreactor metagenome TaxID=1076179 RepID=A0A645HMJ3_9ZZZZ